MGEGLSSRRVRSDSRRRVQDVLEREVDIFHPPSSIHLPKEAGRRAKSSGEACKWLFWLELSCHLRSVA
jgi:hypothetical protein